VSAAAVPPLDAGAAACDHRGYAWVLPDGTIMIDRRNVDRSGVRDVTYRLDDANGYWSYPASTALVVALSLPDGAVKPMSISLAQVTTDRGTVTVCPASVDLPGAKPPADAPALDAPSVERLAPSAHTADPVSCDRPFASARVIKPVAPDTPVLAEQQGITGIVSILVQLDPDGNVGAADVTRSPSSLLNLAALTAVRRSQYSPAIFRCRPIASRYIFRMEFAFAGR